MNLRIVGKYIGHILLIEGVFMLPAFLISLARGEQAGMRGFLIAMAATLLFGLMLSAIRSAASISVTEGFLICGLGWIALSLFGALPFYVSRMIPRYIDCWFETVSGFTTTGSSILSDVEALPYGLLYWRSFSHWIGGMGVLVFLLAIVPMSKGNGEPFQLMKAESPGPEVGKIVPRIGETAKITYLIYLALTVLMILMLLAGGMPLFDSVLNAFATAGTGGFSIKNTSIGYYDSSYLHMTIAVFMALFGVNFSIYYLMFTRRFREILQNEEFRAYWLIMLGAAALIGINIVPHYGGNTPLAFRDSFFAVSSVMTTTGFCTADFNLWPEFSRMLLLVLMCVGACAGSTGGGIKVSRLLLLGKHLRAQMARMIHPRRVNSVRMDGRRVEDAVMLGTTAYVTVYLLIAVLSMLIVSSDEKGLITTISAVLCTFNNIGPGLEIVGPTGNFSSFSDLSKLVLSIDMLLGRLEIFPILFLFSPGVWKKAGIRKRR